MKRNTLVLTIVVAFIALIAVIVWRLGSEPAVAGCVIKGNVNVKGEHIYHMPHQRFYAITDPERWFCTEQEAIAAGFRRSLR